MVLRQRHLPSPPPATTRWLHMGCCLALALGIQAEDGFGDLVERVRSLDAITTLIAREHADPPPPDALWIGAERGIAAALDRHSAYLSADEVAIQGHAATGQTWGFGFDWRLAEDAPEALVTRIVPKAPADGELQPGDRITAIAGKELRQLSRRQAAEAIARSGDETTLAYRRGSEQRSCTLRRTDLVDDGIIQAGWIDEAARIGHIHIGRFLTQGGDATETTTCTGLRRAIAGLAGLRGLVLDLRGCSGGSLQAAVECAAAWVPSDALVVEQVSRNPARQRPWTAAPERFPALPLVVVVDGGTASAAEVLAHALRHHLRAPVVGSRTLGKGGVQQMFLLPKGDALLLTIARLRAPGGAWLDDGLQPDVAVDGDALPRALDAVRALAIGK